MPATACPLLTPDKGALSRAGLRHHLRAVRRSDEAGLRDMFLRCSAEDMRLRCFGASKSFPQVFAARLARLSGPEDFAIVAVLENGEIGGVVHAVGVPGGEADYDIMVRSDLKGQGLGTRLMREMLADSPDAQDAQPDPAPELPAPGLDLSLPPDLTDLRKMERN